ncbi:MAG: hypothetical protein EHM28_04365, partial [Spirochaetaceae bacterium]
MKSECYIADCGIINAIGCGSAAVLEGILAGSRAGLKKVSNLQGDFTVARARPKTLFKLEDKFDNRLDQLLASACEQISPMVQKLVARFGPRRIGVVLGSTDNGSEESLEALKVFRNTGAFAQDYSFYMQEAQLGADFVKKYLGLGSMACNISTACTSSARAIVFGRSLLDLGVCDAVVAGGGDIVSDSVLLGFHALEAVDRQPCNPFSKNRHGINLGEGAALFVLTREPLDGQAIRIAGCGESSDAYHMTAPEPEGMGASAAMSEALDDAGLAPEDIDYINLHGTGTELNDRMESKATARVFVHVPPASSTKTMIGHTLGAAGAMELAICWLLMSPINKEKGLPPHLWD